MTLNEYLESRGVQDAEHYKNVSEADVNPPENLKDIAKAAKILKQHIKKRTPIRILVDTDVDGYTSAAMLYISLEWMNHIGKGELVKYVLHQVNKSHGLGRENDCALELIDDALLIIPDAGTNDDEFIPETDTIILDHHPRELKNPPVADALVNPQCSEKYTNKELCGAGVVYQFLKYISKDKDSYNYDDLCALALIADVMDVRSYETKYLITKGLSDVRNPFFKYLLSYTEKKINGDLSIRNMQMYIVPLINAIIRVGTFEERDLLFKAFCYANPLLHDEVVQIAERCKARQNEMIDNWLKEINIENDKDKNVLIKFSNLPESILGVAAQKLLSKTGKNTILFSLEDPTHGHARGTGNFRTLCTQSGVCDEALGHEQAFGVTIKESNIPKLAEFLNSHVTVAEKSEYDIIESPDFVFNQANLNPLCEFNKYVGTGIDPLLIRFENNLFDYGDISIIGKNKDTLKIAYDDAVNVMIFFYNKNDDLVNKIKRIKKEKKEFLMSATCTVSRSEFFGKRSWSLIAEDYEVIVND